MSAETLTVSKLIDAKAVAEWLSVTTQTLADWRCAGIGPAAIKIGRAVRYEAAEIQRFIDAGRKSGAK